MVGSLKAVTRSEPTRLPIWLSWAFLRNQERPAYPVSNFRARSSSLAWPIHLVADPGVVVGVRDHNHLFLGRLQRLAGGQGHRVPRQLQGEGHQVRELNELLLNAVRDQLPSPLVAGEVVQLLVSLRPLRHDEAGPLGVGPRSGLCSPPRS